MESFTLLKRRTTELFNSLPPAIKSPTFPNISNPLKGKHGDSAHVKATWEKIHGLPPLSKDGHSADVISGTVYIFGGGSGREASDNAVHAVILPSGSAQADYFAIQAKPAFVSAESDGEESEEEEEDDEGDEEKVMDKKAKSMEDISLASPPPATASSSKGKAPVTDNVPSARKGHATAVIGHRIFLFGGLSPSGTLLQEKGRVWVFDTRTHLWSFLNPVPAIQGAEIAFPEARSGHVAVATTKPDKFKTFRSHLQRKTTWREWALGETEKEEEEKGIPQAPVVGVVGERATDKDDEGYGTFIIHGGNGGKRDTWSFDVHSRVWQRLPDAPFGVGEKEKVALALSRSRLYRFARDQLDFLELGVDSFDDFSAADEGEVVISARGQWKSLVKGKEDVGYKEADPAVKPLTSEEERDEEWPGARSGASLEAVAVGGGREYLVLMFGERVDGGQGKYWDDVWAFQIPAEGGSIASATDSILHAVGRKSGEGKWYRVKTSPYDEEDDVSAEGPGARGYAASATMGDLEENGIVVWGGSGGEGEGEKRLGDGWILRLG